MPRRLRNGLLPSCLLALLAFSCQRYEPMPLTRPAVEQPLSLDSDELTKRSSELHHPLLQPVAIDLRNGLTPDAAAVLAVIANPGLRAIRDQHCLASAQLLQAGLLPNPSLEFTLDPVTGGMTEGTVTGYNVGVNWEITALIAHEAKVAAARAGQQSAQLQVAWQEWQFAMAARKAVYDVLALRGQNQLLKSVDQRLAEQLELIRASVQSHQKTLLDLAAIEAASQKAHADFVSSQRDLRQQELMLNQALGLPPAAQVKLRDAGPFDVNNLPSEQELSDEVANRRLDLLALRQGYESQENTLHAAVLAQFPKVVLGFHKARDTTNVQSTGFGVIVELPIFDQQQGAIAIEKATRQKLFDEYAARLFEARSAIALSMSDMRSLSEQIRATEDAIPALERLVKAYEAALAARNLDVLSYYAAQNDLSQKRVDALKLKQQLLDNRIALELAAGRYLQDAATTRPTTQAATQEARP